MDGALVERRIGDAWEPVVTGCSVDVSAIGEVARHQQVGTVRWRFTLPPGAVNGVRVRLPAPAGADGISRRTVVSEVAVHERPPAVPLPAENGGRALLQEERSVRREASANRLDGWWFPKVIEERGRFACRWPLAHLIGEIELEGGDDHAAAPALSWVEGGARRPLPVRELEVVTRPDGSSAKVARFPPLALQELVVELPEGVRVRAVRLGAAGAEELVARLADPRDRWLDVVRDGPFRDDPATIAAQLLPLPANQALLGRAGDAAEVLVTWNGTLLQTSGTMAGRFDHGAADPGGGREGWRLHVVGFAVDGEVLGGELDQVQRAPTSPPARSRASRSTDSAGCSSRAAPTASRSACAACSGAMRSTPPTSATRCSRSTRDRASRAKRPPPCSPTRANGSRAGESSRSPRRTMRSRSRC
jgi:hypothetical protein